MSRSKLGQYLNLDAIIFNLSFLLNPSKLRPDLLCGSILDIEPRALATKHNVKYIVFDKDNTLTKPYENNYPSDEFYSKIAEFKTTFGEKNLGIISNSCGSSDDKDYKEATEVGKNLKIKVIRHEKKKPNVYDDIKREFNFTNSSEVCIIGDRLLVDITMGKKFNFFTILVKPIDIKNENFIVRLMRKLENKLI
jgi:phosphatidylglycerophosphatase GEP4